MRPRRNQGFTLIELTVVMAIVALLLTMAVGAHYAWKRYSALDVAESRAASVLLLARQHAIASGRPALFAFGNGEVPYADDMLRTSLDLSVAATNAASGWCCVLSVTNALDEADAVELLENETEDSFPIAGDVAVFAMPVLWGRVSGFNAENADGELPRYLLFRPDGGLSEECDDTDRWAGPTNVLWGAVDNELGNRKAAQARVLEVLPQTGAARALSREEREALW